MDTIRSQPEMTGRPAAEADGLRPSEGPSAVAGGLFSAALDQRTDSAPTEVVETHISTVFLVGGFAYKVRKPVRFGFLDFTRRVDRLADCKRELALNRRLAPDVYMGVADLMLGLHPIDHMVVMRRLPAACRLSELARRQPDIDHEIDEVAQALAPFHAAAERSPEISAAATTAALGEDWEALFAEAAPFVGSVLDPAIDGEIRLLASRWLAGRDTLLRARIDGGWICDGHGDLQADDVYCLKDGVRILDCLEFSNHLRDGDVAADVAFLVMDLERLGRTAAACRLLRSYEELSGCLIPRSLVHHYCAQRAYVRAAVACLRSAADPAVVDRARVLHQLALSHLRDGRVRMVLVGGLPAAGKSTLAQALADRYGWRLLRSDAVRDELFPLAHDDDATRRSRHDEGATQATYGELLTRAHHVVEEGESVVLDASWTDGRFRTGAHTMANETSTDVVEIECTCRDDIARERLTRRREAGGHDLSDATAAIRATMSQRAEPWKGPIVIDTSIGTPDETLETVVAGPSWQCELPEFGDGVAVRITGADSRSRC